MEIELTGKQILLIAIILLAPLLIIIGIGHIWPSTVDHWGDKFLGPIFYGKVPQ